MTFFANVPVADLGRSSAFYSALGWERDERFASEHGAAFIVSEDVRLMLSDREFFAALLGETGKTVGDPASSCQVAFAFDLPSREDVDTLVERARAAGAAIGSTDDHGFMYQCDFADLDGHQLAPFWMDPAGPPAA